MECETNIDGNTKKNKNRLITYSKSNANLQNMLFLVALADDTGMTATLQAI